MPDNFIFFCILLKHSSTYYATNGNGKLNTNLNLYLFNMTSAAGHTKQNWQLDDNAILYLYHMASTAGQPMLTPPLATGPPPALAPAYSASPPCNPLGMLSCMCFIVII